MGLRRACCRARARNGLLPDDQGCAFPVQGELAATAVNAPMVPAEVLAELQPFVTLAQGLGTAAVQLVGSHGFADVHITYASPRGGARTLLGFGVLPAG